MATSTAGAVCCSSLTSARKSPSALRISCGVDSSLQCQLFRSPAWNSRLPCRSIRKEIPTSVEEKKEEKKEVKAVVNSGPTVITPKKQVTVEPAQAAEKASEGIVKDAQVIEVPQVKKPAALVPAQKSQQQEYKTIAPEQLSADAIQTGAGKLVIVIGQEPFNMTMMTANSGGSLGKVNGKPVVFSILSPDQPYEQMEKAESYTIRFYPTGQTEPTVILECKKLPSPATMEGMPRTYVGEILKAMVK